MRILTLHDKVQESLELIRNYHRKWGNRMFVGHSGGKDSCVVHHLARQVHLFGTVHNPKDEVVPETRNFLYQLSMRCPINFVPKQHMPDFLTRNNLKLQIDGSRQAEWNRESRSTNIIAGGKEVNRKEMQPFVTGGVFGLNILYPIVYWTDADVWRYIKLHNIKVSDEYRESLSA